MSKQDYKTALQQMEKVELRRRQRGLEQTLERLVYEGRRFKALGDEGAYERNLSARGIVTFKLDSIETELAVREELGRK